MTRKIMAAALVALMAAACGSDDDTVGPAPQDPIVGTWVSAGTNVAAGLRAAPFNVDSIRATFNANNSYTVQQYSGGQSTPVVLTGSYQAGAGAAGTIRSIVANQTEGSVTSTGIFQVTGTTMRYEIIQTTPALQGVNPPTVAGGFGSTTIGGQATGQYWVQTYVKR
jgi:hypothetical protein